MGKRKGAEAGLDGEGSNNAGGAASAASGAAAGKPHGPPQARLSIAERKRLKKAHKKANTPPEPPPPKQEKEPKKTKKKQDENEKKKKKPRPTKEQRLQAKAAAAGGQPPAAKRSREDRDVATAPSGGGGGGDGGGGGSELRTFDRWERREKPVPAAPAQGYGSASHGNSRDHASNDARVEKLTRDIAYYAQQKQLSAAKEAFDQIEQEGLAPNNYSYSNLINAYINSGEVHEADAIFAKMKEAGFTPNVVVYTTMLKGCCNTGDVEKATTFLHDMAAQVPPVRPDMRTINTYLRGCVRVGDIDAAYEVFSTMQKKWHVVPDDAAFKYMVRLLSQGLRAATVEEIRERVAKMHAGDTRRFLPLCMFWAQGKCDRGVNCKFYHKPGIIQDGEEMAEMERLDTTMELNMNQAHCAALLGEWQQSNDALNRASSAVREIKAKGGASDQMFKNLKRQEVESEVERLQSYLERKMEEGSDGPDLTTYLCRLFIFSSRLVSETGKAPPALEQKELAHKLVDSLVRTAGLGELVERGQTTLREMKKRLSNCLTKHSQLNWTSLFSPGLEASDAVEKATKLPVKLEVASGNGDWVVAQAKAEQGRTNWVALELKHDRVYSIYSRMVLEEVGNLCVMGGDAGQVLPSHFPEDSIDHVCVNFPEPPHHSGDEAADNKLALLTEEFFCSMARVLVHKGKVTVFSDNRQYCQTLCAMVGKLKSKTGKKIFRSVEVEPTEVGGKTSEVFSGIRLYDGIPGADSGHAANVTSYFDRFWEFGNHTDRVFFTIAKRSKKADGDEPDKA